jgi:hypothetical protein
MLHSMLPHAALDCGKEEGKVGRRGANMWVGACAGSLPRCLLLATELADRGKSRRVVSYVHSTASPLALAYPWAPVTFAQFPSAHSLSCEPCLPCDEPSSCPFLGPMCLATPHRPLIVL